jgi:N-acetylmuramoyl-L-alanine amidase
MIILSGGHYEGAVGAKSDGFAEFPNTLLWAEMVQEYLWKLYRVTAHISPSGTLRQKVEAINALLEASPNRAHAVAVEIHFNSAVGARGSETLYCPGSIRGQSLAQAIQARLGALFPPSRGVKEGWYRMDRPGIVDYWGDEDGDEKPDYFLKMTHCPAAIVEPEFVQNRHLLESGQPEACEAIARGIMENIA